VFIAGNLNDVFLLLFSIRIPIASMVYVAAVPCVLIIGAPCIENWLEGLDQAAVFDELGVLALTSCASTVVECNFFPNLYGSSKL